MELFDRLRYNVLPLDMERPTIRESIGAAESHLAEMEALDLPDTLSEKAALRQYISHYSSLLAPIRRLSVEILQIIFLDPNLHDSERIAFDFVTMYRPDAFVGVSYHWREVAHGTAKLWASFQITLHSGRCSNIHRIRRGLERSKNVPLSINFSPFAFSPESHTLEARMHTQAVEEIAAEFLLHAERWAYVMLPPKNHQFLSILCPARGRLPMLEAVGFLGRPDEEARQLKIFEEAPSLRSLSLHDANTMNIPPVPYHQLTQAYIPWDTRLFSLNQISALALGLRRIIIGDEGANHLRTLRGGHVRDLLAHTVASTVLLNSIHHSYNQPGQQVNRSEQVLHKHLEAEIGEMAKSSTTHHMLLYAPPNGIQANDSFVNCWGIQRWYKWNL
ncbi:hypothetical protein K438DRAFT_1778684 [Mycena galopus ATCC 62051]|nr:hypothetical protein K438DRAFT_1778684 [Mycena galopus ATCC 62051]